MKYRIIRLKSVMEQTGYPRSTLNLRISQGLFSKPISLGSRAVGWPEHEIDTLNAARIAGMCDDEIRELVIELEANRKTLLNMVRAQ
jgi:prophage regulatory protein